MYCSVVGNNADLVDMNSIGDDPRPHVTRNADTLRKSGIQAWLQELWAFRKTVIILLTPILLFPMVAVSPGDKVVKCGYAGLVMAVFWTTEALPLAVTALLPIILFPFLGVLSSKEVCVNYLKDANVLFMAGLMVAVAIEDCNLHKRIALRVLMLVGSQPKWLLFGFMGVTAFLSMWISNTATTAMMVPIAQAVIDELEKHNVQTTEDDNVITSTHENGMASTTRSSSALVDLDESRDDRIAGVSTPSSSEISKRNDSYRVSVCEEFENFEDCSAEVENIGLKQHPDSFKRLVKGLTICICYSANIGGTATLTGTGPNMVFKGIVDNMSREKSGVTFASWMLMAFPNMILCLVICWVWLQVFFLGWRSVFSCCDKKKTTKDNTANKVIKKEYEKLGSWTFAEIAVLVHFTALALLWLTRKPEFIDGWSALLEDGYVTDAATGMLIVFALFIFPSQRPNFFCCRARNDNSKSGPVPALLTWKKVQQKLAWDVIFLLGGGFALADAAQKSGLSAWLGQKLTVLSVAPVWAVLMVISFLVAGITEFTSNISTTTVFLPIVAEVAIAMDVNPLMFMVAATISSSFAFMLPVATPPNAIVFAYGNLRVLDMVKAGILMNFVCILCLQLTLNTWGYALLGLGDMPNWVQTDNSTVTTQSPC